MSEFFTYKNIKAHYKSFGRGSTIVLLHGFLENLNMWDFLTPSLTRNRRIITIDLLGHGETENLGYVHTMEEQAELVRELLRSLNVRKATFIGHSMGGYIALAFADLFPKNTKGICLLNSTSYADTTAKKVSRDRAIKAVKENHKTFINVSIPMLFSEENRTLLKGKIRLVTKEALSTSKQGIIASLEGMKIRVDRTHILKNNAFKTLLILGKKDTVLDIKTHIKQIENTETEFLEIDEGHMSHIEMTNNVVSALIKFC